MAPLKDSEIQEFLAKHSEWSLQEGRLERTYKLENFARAMVFVNRMVNPIEEFQTYPVVRIAYNRVTVSLFNNMQGCLTQSELKVALEIDHLL